MDEVKSKSAGKKAPRKAAASNGKPTAARTPKVVVAAAARTQKVAVAAPAAGAGRISPEERHRLIAEAAYYRASQRGFGGGAEVEDWLAAEAEVDGKLLGRSS